jgi:hypothetical protein
MRYSKRYYFVMKNFSSGILYICYSSILFLSACTYHKDNIDPTEAICTDTIQNVSFSKEVNPILTANCTTAGCHSGTNPQSNLNLEAAKAYAALSKRGSGYLDTINPTSSVLFSSLMSVSSPMPPKGRLSACDLKRIQVWMQEGAKDN